MGKFLDYNPDQAYLLPPNVRDVLGDGHLCFFLRRLMAKLNLATFREEYGREGGPAYAPEMLASVWLYAYALSVTSSRRLERLQKSGLKKISQSDPDSRFLRERGGFVLGYTGTLAVSGDHLIVAQRVTQETNDNEALLPMVDLVEQQCGERPQQVSADSGFFSHANLEAMEERNIDGYVPDNNLARVLNRGGRLCHRAIHPAHQRMRRKLRDPAGRALYARRKAIVEPVNGVLKEQRGMRRFRMKGLQKVAVEWTLASIAYNLTRLWRSN